MVSIATTVYFELVSQYAVKCTSHTIDLYYYGYDEQSTNRIIYKRRDTWEQNKPLPIGTMHLASWLLPLVQTRTGVVVLMVHEPTMDVRSMSPPGKQLKFPTNSDNYYVRNSSDSDITLLYGKYKYTWYKDVGYATVRKGDLEPVDGAPPTTFRINISSYNEHAYGHGPSIRTVRDIKTDQMWDFFTRATLTYPVMDAHTEFKDTLGGIFRPTPIPPPLIHIQIPPPTSAQVTSPAPQAVPSANVPPVAPTENVQPVPPGINAPPVVPSVPVPPEKPSANTPPIAPMVHEAAFTILSAAASPASAPTPQPAITPPAPTLPAASPATPESHGQRATSKPTTDVNRMVLDAQEGGSVSTGADMSHNDIIALLTKFAHSDVVAPDFFITQSNDAFYPPNKLMDLYGEGMMKLEYLQTIDESIVKLLTGYTIHRFVMFLDKEAMADMYAVVLPHEILDNISVQLGAADGGTSSIVASFIKACNAEINVDIGTINSTMQVDDDLQRIVDLGEEILSEDVYNPANRQSADVFHVSPENMSTVVNFRQTMFSNKGEISFMSLKPREEIPKEIHINTDQIIILYHGSLTVTISDPIDLSKDTSVEALQDLPTKKYELNLTGDMIIIPSNRYHTVTASQYGCRIASIYTRAYHKKGTVHHTLKDAQE